MLTTIVASTKTLLISYKVQNMGDKVQTILEIRKDDMFIELNATEINDLVAFLGGSLRGA